MNPRTTNSSFRVVLIFVLVVLISGPAVTSLHAQDSSATLSGTVTDSSGKPVPNAKVTVKNTATGRSTETQTDSAGLYTLPNLAGGDYEVSASAAGVGVATAKATLTIGSSQTLPLTVTSATSVPAENLPNAPAPNKTEPSLEDLGFSKTETQADAAQQALLDRRTHRLKMHQRFGLITTVPLLATLITSVKAGGKSTSTTDRNVHLVLGAVTGDLYGITAYYAIRAPRIAGTQTKGPIKLHKALAWVHGPGMILTPILGAMAYSQKSNGEKVHGIAAAHGPVAIVTAGAFGAALLSVSLKF
ncbi:MAG TPA: carboxypeptidase-like regulatory domain-containing protein [Candidatus Sulfotelmatobacter sp.]